MESQIRIHDETSYIASPMHVTRCLPPHKEHISNAVDGITISYTYSISVKAARWAMFEKWLLVLPDNLALNNIDIDRANRGSVLTISATEKYAIDVSIKVNRQRISSVGQELWVAPLNCRDIKLPKFCPTSAHIFLNLVLGTLERSVALPR
jgi:hypothetical protein